MEPETAVLKSEALLADLASRAQPVGLGAAPLLRPGVLVMLRQPVLLVCYRSFADASTKQDFKAQISIPTSTGTENPLACTTVKSKPEKSTRSQGNAPQ